MNILQHYTSRAGLEGIARSKVFWATDFFDVNDRSEMLYGYTEITKAAGGVAWKDMLRAMS
jgi:hypothetical protein